MRDGGEAVARAARYASVVWAQAAERTAGLSDELLAQMHRARQEMAARAERAEAAATEAALALETFRRSQQPPASTPLLPPGDGALARILSVGEWEAIDGASVMECAFTPFSLSPSSYRMSYVPSSFTFDTLPGNHLDLP